jgi:hypothetical protein
LVGGALGRKAARAGEEGRGYYIDDCRVAGSTRLYDRQCRLAPMVVRVGRAEWGCCAARGWSCCGREGAGV